MSVCGATVPIYGDIICNGTSVPHGLSRQDFAWSLAIGWFHVIAFMIIHISSEPLHRVSAINFKFMSYRTWLVCLGTL